LVVCDELLGVETFDTPVEAQVLVERRRRHRNTMGPHGSPGYRPLGPQRARSWVRSAVGASVMDAIESDAAISTCPRLRRA